MLALQLCMSSLECSLSTLAFRCACLWWNLLTCLHVLHSQSNPCRKPRLVKLVTLEGASSVRHRMQTLTVHTLHGMWAWGSQLCCRLGWLCRGVSPAATCEFTMVGLRVRTSATQASWGLQSAGGGVAPVPTALTQQNTGVGSHTMHKA
jgi:hypothetical protein